MKITESDLITWVLVTLSPLLKLAGGLHVIDFWISLLEHVNAPQPCMFLFFQ